jgi:type IV pilus assembly protein PilN
MILINLLPHREAAKKRKKEIFFFSLGVSALLGGVLSVLFSYYLSARIEEQKIRNDFLTEESKKLDGQIKDIAGLQSEIASLKARQQSVEDLQADRNLPVHILSELVSYVPNGIFLTSLKQTGLTLSVTGQAQSQERVSELLRNFSTKTQWLIKPELVEIISVAIAVTPKEQRKIFNFQLKLTVARQKDVDGLLNK